MAVKKEAPRRKISGSVKKTKPEMSKASDRQLKIELIRSVIGHPKKQREIVKGLGLRKLHSVVVRKDCPEVRGMIRKIPHLVKMEVLEKQ
jgi:large subunit ribosomal protein L30